VRNLHTGRQYSHKAKKYVRRQYVQSIFEATYFQNVKASSLQIALRAKTPIIFQIIMISISMNFIKAAIGGRIRVSGKELDSAALKKIRPTHTDEMLREDFLTEDQSSQSSIKIGRRFHCDARIVVIPLETRLIIPGSIQP
jgi:hypothetical protein